MDQNHVMMAVSEKLLEACENTEKVFLSGKKDEYDAFWDAKQPLKDTPASLGGEYGGRWTVESFRPKYDLVPTYSQYMFYVNNLKIDLVEHLKNIGIKLDFSQCKNMGATFMGAAFTHIGSVCGNGVGTGSVFQSCKNLVTIDEFGHCEGGNIAAGTNSTFSECYALENITIKGYFIGDVYFHWSKNLSKASIISIINALSDNVSGRTLQLSKTAADNAFPCMWDNSQTGETENVGCNVNGEWLDLTASKSNWTITLI